MPSEEGNAGELTMGLYFGIGHNRATRKKGSPRILKLAHFLSFLYEFGIMQAIIVRTSRFWHVIVDYLSSPLFTAVVGGCFFEEGDLVALSLGRGKATDKPFCPAFKLRR